MSGSLNGCPEKVKIETRTIAFAGSKLYMAEIGAAVFGDDGEEHVIEHNGVAAHPGDEGMAVIADRILEWVFWLE